MVIYLVQNYEGRTALFQMTSNNASPIRKLKTQPLATQSWAFSTTSVKENTNEFAAAAQN